MVVALNLKRQLATRLNYAALNAASQSSLLDKKTEARTGAVITPKPKPFMTVISEEESKMQTMQTIKMKCDKCDNNMVYVWQVQTRGGDEASTQFMRCTKCGHTFREYT